MIDFFSFSLCLLAFNAFALAKSNHFKDLFNKRPNLTQRKRCLFVAWISILLSLTVCAATQGAYGVLLFFGITNLSALIIMIFYSFFVHYIKFMIFLNLIALPLSGLFLVLKTH
jgi:hypothetical protein